MSTSQNPENESAPKKRGRKPKTVRRTAVLTVKMMPEMLLHIEETVVKVQAMAKTRAPDKADVLCWMLSRVRPEDLKQKLDQWNQLFE